MSAIHWLNPISGSFTNGADWGGGTVPGTFDNAILDAPGAAFTVTSQVDETVKTIELGANATLAISGGTFDARDGTGAHLSNGAIDVTGAGVLEVAGMLNDLGSISTTYGHASMTMTADTTLTGGCVIVADGNINVGASGVTVTNVDDTIAGYGALFSQNPSGTTFINEAGGVVEFAGSDNAFKAFDIGQSGGNALGIVNDGLIDTGFGPIFINDCNISGAGTITLGIGSVLQTFGGTITGQTLSVAEGAVIAFNATTVDYSGVLDNQGLIELRNGDLESLSVQGSATLTGGGSFNFGDQGTVIGGAAGGTLVNADNTLVGIGDLGAGQISIDNEADGVIDGGQIIDCGAGTFTNSGKVFGFGLSFASAVNNTGTIYNFVGSGITFDSAVFSDGFMKTAKGSLIFKSTLVNNGVLVERKGLVLVEGAVSGTGVAKINGGTLEFASAAAQSVIFNGGGILVLDRSLAFSGVIAKFSAVGALIDLRDVGFVSPGEATFSGTARGGVLTVTDGAHTVSLDLKGDYLGSHFVARSDGQGGVSVVAAQGAPTRATLSNAFVAAMAAMSTAGSGALAAHGPPTTPPPMLTRPGD